MVTKENWKNKIYLYSFSHIYSTLDSLGQGNLPTGPQAEVTAPRKDVQCCNWKEAVSQEAEGVCCGVLGLISELCLELPG